MIKSITHDDNGTPLQRLSVSTKVAIGLPPDEKAGRKAPTKLDRFIFLRKKPGGKGNDWEEDPVLMDFYGKDCKEVEIVLLDDDLDNNVFPTKLAWFTASELKCWGDGKDATRRTEDAPTGKPWGPCMLDGCPDFAEGRCKPSGDLRFMLSAFPQLGAIARIHTSSHRSVRQIHSSLEQIRRITGRLTGLKLTMVVRPEQASYFDKRANKRKTTTIFALNLETNSNSFQKMLSGMTEAAGIMRETQRMLGTSRVEVFEDDDERAEEIHSEFHSQEEEPESRTQRKERERGALEPGKEQNRGHGNEGFVAEKNLSTSAPAPAEAATSVAPDTAKREPELLYVKILKVDARETALKPEQVAANKELEAKNEPPKYAPNPYLLLKCEGGTSLYVYDKKLHIRDLLAVKPGTSAGFMTTVGNQGHVSVKEIVDIGGARYVRDPDSNLPVLADAVKATEAWDQARQREAARVIKTIERGRITEVRRVESLGKDYLLVKIAGLPDDRRAEQHAIFYTDDPTQWELIEQAAKVEGVEISFSYEVSVDDGSGDPAKKGLVRQKIVAIKEVW